MKFPKWFPQPMEFISPTKQEALEVIMSLLVVYPSRDMSDSSLGGWKLIINDICRRIETEKQDGIMVLRQWFIFVS